MFGHKTVAWFDLWTIQHILFGVGLTSILRSRFNLKGYRALVGAIAIAYGWELIEYLAEIGHAGSVIQVWLQGTEFWANRFIADPIIAITLGWFIMRKFPWFNGPAMVASIWWWFFHIVIFPHCMYLQTAEAWTHWYAWSFAVTYVLGTATFMWLFRSVSTAPIRPDILTVPASVD